MDSSSTGALHPEHLKVGKCLFLSCSLKCCLICVWSRVRLCIRWWWVLTEVVTLQQHLFSFWTIEKTLSSFQAHNPWWRSSQWFEGVSLSAAKMHKFFYKTKENLFPFYRLFRKDSTTSFLRERNPWARIVLPASGWICEEREEQICRARHVFIFVIAETSKTGIFWEKLRLGSENAGGFFEESANTLAFRKHKTWLQMQKSMNSDLDVCREHWMEGGSNKQNLLC